MALRYVGQWGGNACRDAGKFQSGQCKQYVNCVVFIASAGRYYPAPGYQDAFARVAIEVSAQNALRGDIVQIGNSDSDRPLHTAIVLQNNHNGTFEVVDSNWALDELVRVHTYSPPAGARYWRVGDETTTDTTSPVVSWSAPATGATISSRSVTLQAHATDSGGKHLSTVSFSAKWNGTWHGLSAVGVSGDVADPSYTWDLCAANVPDGDIELGLEATDGAGNKYVYSDHAANRHITKSYNCGSEGDGGIDLCDGPDYNAPCVRYTAGKWNLAGRGLDNRIESVRYVGSYVGTAHAVLFMDANQQGGYWHADVSTGNIPDTFDNQVSSVEIYVRDLTPPVVEWLAPADGTRVTSRSLTLSAHVTDTGGDPAPGLGNVTFSAFWDGAWHSLSTQNASGSSADVSYAWDMCADAVPDGEIVLGMVARDSAGHNYTYSEHSPDYRITKDFDCDPAPPAPTNVVATGISPSEIRLTWTDVAGEAGYRIKRWNESGWPILVDNLSAGTTSYTDSGLLASQAYSYLVCAFNDSGERCTRADGTTTAPPTPPAPTNVVASGASPSRSG